MLKKVNYLRSLSCFLAIILWSSPLGINSSLAVNDNCQLSESEIKQQENLRQTSPQEYNILFMPLNIIIIPLNITIIPLNIILPPSIIIPVPLDRLQKIASHRFH